MDYQSLPVEDISPGPAAHRPGHWHERSPPCRIQPSNSPATAIIRSSGRSSPRPCATTTTSSWSRAELETELDGAGVLAIGDAIARLADRGVIELAGETVRASRAAVYLDELDMIAV